MSVELRDAVQGEMEQVRADLAELVSFESVADPELYPAAECDKAAEWVRAAFAEAGLEDVAMSRTTDGSLAVHGHAPAPAGAPTVLLYSHYDVQPPLGEQDWTTPPFELAERDGRWYGRGAADCKGNVVAQLASLRALRKLRGGFPTGVKLICEGSEEQGTGGLEAFVPQHAELLAAEAILVCDTGNFAAGVPTLTTALRGVAIVDVTVSALKSALHSGMFGGAAPDPVAGLIAMLASTHDEHGNATVDGVDASGSWEGVEYPPAQFRADAQVLDGVELIGSRPVAEMLWARPSVTVLGIDIPSVSGSTASIQPRAAARVSLRVPPGHSAQAGQDALIAHLRKRVPWNLRCDIEAAGLGEGFVGSLRGPAFETMKAAMEEAYGRRMITQGEGGSIPLCNVFAETYPEAEIFLLGVEEPKCLIHAPNESVDPSEIERIALAQALFIDRYGGAER